MNKLYRKVSFLLLLSTFLFSCTIRYTTYGYSSSDEYNSSRNPVSISLSNSTSIVSNTEPGGEITSAGLAIYLQGAIWDKNKISSGDDASCFLSNSDIIPGLNYKISSVNGNCLVLEVSGSPSGSKVNKKNVSFTLDFDRKYILVTQNYYYSSSLRVYPMYYVRGTDEV